MSSSTIATVDLTDAQVVAVLAAPLSKAPFGRARVVVRSPRLEQRVRVTTYLVGQRACGEALTVSDLESLEASGQLLKVEAAVPARMGAMAWVLRDHLPRLGRYLVTLKSKGILIASIARTESGWLAVVNESDSASLTLLHDWRDQCLQEAERLALSGCDPAALAEAEAAHGMDLDLSPQTLAWLSVLYERLGREQRARGLLDVARNTGGEPLASAVSAEVASLRGRLGGSSRTSRRQNVEAALRGKPSYERLGTCLCARLADVRERPAA